MVEKKIEVVVSFSSKDVRLITNYLMAHLEPLKESGLINLWYYPQENAGTRWEANLNERFNSADIILMVLSRNFVSAEYCKKEVRLALELEKNKDIKIIPILFNEVHWANLGINVFFATPEKFISDDFYWGTKKDKAYTIVAKDIEKVCIQILNDRNQQAKDIEEAKNILLENEQKQKKQLERKRTRHKVNKKYGYKDGNNGQPIKYKYIDARKFSNGLAAVSITTPNIYGYINIAGELVIPFNYTKAEPFKNGVAKVAVNVKEIINKEEVIISKEFFIDKEGNIVKKVLSPFQFSIG